ncbi:Membrane associated serine protease, rhomboid family [Catalinimonas alkaloidigena]|uniref:Membrane associated serine protease, rhomboid family n=1 Tax=Catalinimonas alkaloidigena TaxID=1075417 RepID=A0A1G9F6E4_9BACT|nr:rhomboid family intramembrane serine protease [Catalinimonas alkaloidigena]SDK83954.1 Membrane associated serine protease, rhomboid family [Catalinimonas alkaloidigena]
MSLSLTLIVIIITVVTSLLAWNNANLFERWMFTPYLIRTRNQYDRFLTSGFIHNDWGHLLFNMITLYFFGTAVEQYFRSPLLFLVLYLVGIVVSSLPTYAKHKNHSHYHSLGASGGVSAILFSAILFDPIRGLYLFFIPIPIPGFIFGILYLFYSAYRAKQANDNINHDAHLYGALFGVAFTLVLFPSVISNFFYQLANWNIFN